MSFISSFKICNYSLKRSIVGCYSDLKNGNSSESNLPNLDENKISRCEDWNKRFSCCNNDDSFQQNRSGPTIEFNWDQCLYSPPSFQSTSPQCTAALLDISCFYQCSGILKPFFSLLIEQDNNNENSIIHNDSFSDKTDKNSTINSDSFSDKIDENSTIHNDSFSDKTGDPLNNYTYKNLHIDKNRVTSDQLYSKHISNKNENLSSNSAVPNTTSIDKTNGNSNKHSSKQIYLDRKLSTEENNSNDIYSGDFDDKLTEYNQKSDSSIKKTNIKTNQYIYRQDDYLNIIKIDPIPICMSVCQYLYSSCMNDYINDSGTLIKHNETSESSNGNCHKVSEYYHNDTLSFCNLFFKDIFYYNDSLCYTLNKPINQNFDKWFDSMLKISMEHFQTKQKCTIIGNIYIWGALAISLTIFFVTLIISYLKNCKRNKIMYSNQLKSPPTEEIHLL